MSILFLPGQKPENREWINQFAELVSKCSDSSTVVHEYRSWVFPELDIDPEYEIDLFAKYNPDCVIAKSLGTLLCALAIERGLIAPKAIVLVGIPLSGIGETELKWFSNLGTVGSKVLVIQQTSDRVGRFDKVHDSLPTQNYTFKEVQGSDHKYSNVVELSEICLGWLSKYQLTSA